MGALQTSIIVIITDVQPLSGGVYVPRIYTLAR